MSNFKNKTLLITGGTGIFSDAVSVIIAIMSMIVLLGCNKDNEPNVDPVEIKTYQVSYIVNKNESSPIFDYKITYVDENGKEQTEQVSQLPWVNKVEVKAPFTASFSVHYSLKKGVDIPDVVRIGKNYALSITQGSDFSYYFPLSTKIPIPKDRLERYLSTKNPIISAEYEIKK